MCGKENDRVYTMLSRKAHLENGHVLQCEVPRRYFLGLCSRRVEHCDCHDEVWLLSPVNTCVFVYMSRKCLLAHIVENEKLICPIVGYLQSKA